MADNTPKQEKQTEVFDKNKINGKELTKYEGSYTEGGFKDKLVKYGVLLGAELAYKAAQLWYVLQRPDVPAKTKAVIMGALGYLIAPLDFLPDMTPVLGYSDDVVAITFALIQVQGYIDDDVKAKSQHLIAKIFGDDVVKSLK